MKVINRKSDKLYDKGYDNSVNSWIDKKDIVCKFSKTETFRRKWESWIRLSYYATKADLKNAVGVDTSTFAKKVDLVNLKSEIDKLDIDK